MKPWQDTTGMHMGWARAGHLGHYHLFAAEWYNAETKQMESACSGMYADTKAEFKFPSVPRDEACNQCVIWLEDANTHSAEDIARFEREAYERELYQKRRKKVLAKWKRREPWRKQFHRERKREAAIEAAIQEEKDARERAERARVSPGVLLDSYPNPPDDSLCPSCFKLRPLMKNIGLCRACARLDGWNASLGRIPRENDNYYNLED